MPTSTLHFTVAFKPSGGGPRFPLIAMLLLSPLAANATPAGGVVVTHSDPLPANTPTIVLGNAGNSFNTTIGLGTNGTSIISWTSFDTASGETVTFTASASGTRVLNWVNSVTQTTFNGTLTAPNISVYLVNPSGVFFGGTSVVNAGAIYAAAGNLNPNDPLTQTDFASGLLKVTGVNGAVSNAGTITASNFAVLAGKTISNTGTIVANGATGFVGMATDDTISFAESGSSITVNVPRAVAPASGTTAITNSGSVTATNVRLAAGDLYAVAIANSGLISATGNINASNYATGGAITTSGTGSFSSTGSVTFSGTGDVGASGSHLTTKAATVTFNKTGGASFIDNKLDGGTSLSGSTTGSLTVKSLNSAGTLADALTIAAGGLSSGSTTLDGTTLTLTGGLSGTDVAVTQSGATTGAGLVTGTTSVAFNGTGTVGTSGAHIATKTATVTFNKTGGDSFVDNKLDGGVTVSGTSSAGVTLKSLDTAGTAAAAATVGASGLSATTTSLDSSSLTLTGALGGTDVSLTQSGATTGAGLITGSTSVAFNGTGTVGTSGAHIATKTATVTFNKTGGDSFVDNKLDGGVTVSGTSTAGVTLKSLDTAGTAAAAATVGASGLSATTTSIDSSSLTLTGALGGTDVSLTQSGATTGAGLVTGSTSVAFNGTGAVGTSGAHIATKTATVTFNKTGGASFVDNKLDGGVTVSGTSSAGVALKSLDTAGTAAAAATVGASGLGATTTSIDSSSLTLTGALSGTDVSLTQSGATTGAGLVTGTTSVAFNGAGTVGTSGAHIATKTATVTFNKTGGASFVDNKLDGGVTVSGTSSAGVTLKSLDTAGTAAAAATVGASGLSATTTSLDSSSLTLTGALGGTDVSLTQSGATTGAGLITGSTSVAFNGTGTIGTSGAHIATKTATVTFNKTGGASFVDNKLDGGVTVSGTSSAGVALKSLDTAGTAAAAATIGASGLSATTTSIDSSTLALTGALSGSDVSLTQSGATTGTGLITGTTSVAFNGAGAVGTSGAHLTTKTTSVTFNKAGGDSFIDNKLDGGVTVAGSSSAGVTLKSLDTAGTTAAAATVGATGLGATTTSIDSSTLALNGGLTGTDVTLNQSGDTTGAGKVTGSTSLTFTGIGNVGSSSSSISTSTPSITLDKSAGNFFAANGRDGGVTLTTTTQTGSLSLSSKNTALDADAALVVGNSSASSSIDVGTNDLILQGGALTLNDNLKAKNLTLSNSGSNLTSNHTIEATNLLTLGGSGGVGTSGSALVAKTGAVAFAKTADGSGNGATVNFQSNSDTGVTVSGSVAGKGTNLTVTSKKSDGTTDGSLTIAGTGLTIDPNGGAATATLNAAATTVSGALSAGTTTLGINATTIDGAGDISGGAVSITNSGAYTGTGKISGGTSVAFIGTGDVGTVGTAVNTSTQALALNKTGGLTNVSNTRDAGTTLSGTTTGDLTVKSLNTAGDAAAGLTIGSGNLSAAKLALDSSTLGLTGTTTGTDITLTQAGNTTGSGKVTATGAAGITFAGAGDVGTSGSSIKTSTSQITLNKSAGKVFAVNGLDAGVTLLTTAQAGTVSLRSQNTAFDADAALTVGDSLTPTTLNTGSGDLVLRGSTVTLNDAIKGENITLNNASGTITSTQAIEANNQLTLAGTGNFGTSGIAQSVKAAKLNLAKTASTSGDGATVNVQNNRTGGLTVLGNVTGKSAALTVTSKQNDGTTAESLGVDAAGLTVDPNGGSASTTFNAAAITLGGTVDVGASAITLNGSTFDGAGDVKGATVKVNNSGAYTGTGTLTGATSVTFTGGGDVGASSGAIKTSTPTLAINKTGGKAFLDNGRDAGVTLLTVAQTDTLSVSSHKDDFTTDADLTAGDSAAAANVNTVAGDLILKGANVTLNDNLKGENITLTNSSGTITSTHSIVANNQLTLDGTGSDGTSGTALVVSAAKLNVAKTADGSGNGATVNVQNNLDAGLTLNGSVTGKNAAVTIASKKLDGTTDAGLTIASTGFKVDPNGGSATTTLNAGSVALGGDLDLGTSTGTLNGADFSGAGVVTAGDLTIQNSGAYTGSGSVNASTSLTFKGAGDLGTSGAAVSSTTPVITFNKTGGDSYVTNKRDAGTTVSGSTTGSLTLVSQNAADTNSSDLTVAASGLSAGSTSLVSHALTLSGNVSGTDVTLTQDGATTGSATVTGSASVVFAGTGEVGSAGSAIKTSTTLMGLNKTAGKAFIHNGSDTGVQVLTLSQKDTLSLTSHKSDFSTDADLIIGTTLAPQSLDVGTGDLIYKGANVTLNDNLKGENITLTNSSGTITSTHSIVANNQLTLDGTGSDGTSGTALVVSAAKLNVAKTADGSGNGATVNVQNNLDAGLTLNGSVTGKNAAVTIASKKLDGTTDAGLTIASTGFKVDPNGGSATTTLNAGSVALGGDLDLGTSTGTLNGADFSGAGVVTAGDLTIQNSGAYTGSGSVNASTSLTFKGAGDLGTSGAAVKTTTPSIVFAKTGGDSHVVNKREGGVTVAGSTSGGSLSLASTDASDADAALVVGGASLSAGGLSLTSSSLALGGSVSGSDVTLTQSGVTSGSGLVSGSSSLALNGTGDVGSSASAINTNAPVISFSKSAGSAFVLNKRDAGTTVSGSVSGPVGLTSKDSSGALDAALAIGSGNLSAANLSLTSSSLSLGGAVTGNDVTLTQSAATTGTGLVTATTGLHLVGTGDVGSGSALINTKAPVITFNKSAGSAFVANKLDGGTTISGSVSGPLTLTSQNTAGTSDEALTIASANLSAGDTALTSSTLGLTGTITGSKVTLTQSGATTGAGLVTAATQLILNGTGDVGASGASINTKAPAITFGKTAGSVFVTNKLSGGTSLDGTVAGSLVVDSKDDAGTADAALGIGGTGLTAGSTSLTSSSLALNAALNGSDVTLTQSGATSGASVVSGSTSVTFKGTGNVGSSGSLIKTSTPLITVDKTAGGLYVQNGRDAGTKLVTTHQTGDLTVESKNTAYTADADLTVGDTGAIDVGSNAIAFKAANITINDSLKGGQITVNASGDLTSNKALQSTNAITLGGANITLNASVDGGQITAKATGDFTSNKALQSTNATKIDGTNITFNDSLKGSEINATATGNLTSNKSLQSTAGNITLTADATNGTITIKDGAVLSASDAALTAKNVALNVESGGANKYDKPAIQAGKNITIDGAVSLLANTYISAGGESVTFKKSVSGSKGLAVDLKGGDAAKLTFEGDIGSESSGNAIDFLDVRAPSVVVQNIYTNNELTLDFGSASPTSTNSLEIQGNVLKSGKALLLGSGARSTSGGTARTALPGSATIFKKSGDLTLEGSSVTVSAYERLVVQDGNLLIQATGTAPTANIKVGDVGTVTVGDVSVSKTLAISSGKTFIRARIADGANDAGTSIVAGKVLLHNSILDSKPKLTLADITGTSANATANIPVASGNTYVEVVGPTGATPTSTESVLIADITDDATILRPSLLGSPVYLKYSGPSDATNGTVTITATSDGHSVPLSAKGTPRRQADQTFTPVIAREQPRAIVADTELDAAARKQLSELGLFTRPLNSDEKKARVSGRALYTEVPEQEVPRAQDYLVVDARMPSANVRAALKRAVDAGVLGETTSLEAVASALARSFQVYSEESKLSAATGYRSWLANRTDDDSKSVVVFLSKVRDTLEGIQNLGVTRAEFAGAKVQVLDRLANRLGADVVFLRELIDADTSVSTAQAVKGKTAASF